MPIVPIIAAGIAWAGAAGAVGAVTAGGLSALTLTGALEITAAVGATLGAVGSVTRDKGLMTAGLVIGGIGGIGSLAASAGLLGDGASTASLFGTGDAASYLPGGAAAGDAAAAASGLSLPPSAAGIQAGTETGIVNAFGGVDATSAAAATGASDVAGQASLAGGTASDNLTTSLLNGSTDLTGGAGIPPIPHVQGLIDKVPVNTSALAPAAPAAPSTFAQSLGQVTGPASVSGPLAPVPTEAPGVLDALGSFTKNNPLATYGMIQAGGSFVSGLFNPVTPAQVSALKAQTAKTQAETAISQRQAEVAGEPIPVATRSLPSTGMINTNAGTY